MNSVVNKMNTQVSGLLKNTYVNWALRIILVLYAAFAHVPEDSMIQALAENIVFRLVVAVLIVYLSFNDPTLAILLSICFVITIQGVNKNKVTELTKMTEKFYGETDQEEEEEEASNPAVLDDDDVGEGFKEEEKECDYDNKDNCNGSKGGKCSWTDDSSGGECQTKTEKFYGGIQEDEEDDQNPPTGTESFSNFKIGGAPLDNSNILFTSESQLNSAQDDTVPGSDESSIQTFKKQYSAQGNGSPPGINNSPEFATF
jgi:hypothetical protein